MKKLFLIIVLLLISVPTFGQGQYVITDYNGIDSLGWQNANHKTNFFFRTQLTLGQSMIVYETTLKSKKILQDDKILFKCRVIGGSVHAFIELYNDLNPSIGSNVETLMETGQSNPYLFQLPSGTIGVNRIRIQYGYFPFEYGARNVWMDSMYTTNGVTLINPYDLTDVTHIEIPISFAVSQNFPNPFNPATKIRVSLPASQVVRAVVYNQLGEEVAVIADGEFSAGEHEILFNGTNLPSGLYICRVNSGNQQQIIKMTLLK
jgi:hypothetical protein